MLKILEKTPIKRVSIEYYEYLGNLYGSSCHGGLTFIERPKSWTLTSVYGEVDELVG